MRIQGNGNAIMIFAKRTVILNQKNIKTVQAEETQVVLNYLKMKNKTFYDVNNI